jgi:acetylornithine deacetylase
MRIDPIQLTRRLVDIPSVTGDEAAVAAELQTILESIGLEVRRHPVAGERFNLLATRSSRTRVLFCSHIDTVPPHIPSSEDGEWIRGRGTCDAKGIIAAMIAAVAELPDDAGAGFLLVVGEETDSIGAKRANEDLDVGSEYVIVGEPTDSVFVSACKGAFTARVRFRGVAAHSAYPERGDSAISRLSRAIVAIDDSEWGFDERLGHGTANVGTIAGGGSANVIPAEAELELMIRSVEEPDAVRTRLASIVESEGGEIVESYGGSPVFLYVPEGEDSKVVAFGTDAPYLDRFGKRILFGPGSILEAHRKDEKIRKSEILSAVETYRHLARTLIGG